MLMDVGPSCHLLAVWFCSSSSPSQETRVVLTVARLCPPAGPPRCLGFLPVSRCLLHSPGKHRAATPASCSDWCQQSAAWICWFLCLRGEEHLLEMKMLNLTWIHERLSLGEEAEILLGLCSIHRSLVLPLVNLLYSQRVEPTASDGHHLALESMKTRELRQSICLLTPSSIK